jgi:excisionase family DNA binding protein
MDAPRDKLHRLVDALPDKETLSAQRFLEFLLHEGGGELTPKQIAQRVNITPKKIRKLLREGKLPGRKVGREWLIKERDLEAVLDPGAYFGATLLGSGPKTQ